MLTSAGVREEGYEIDDVRGTIASPGKFEGEPWWVVALWDATLEGGADRYTDDDDSPIAWFKVNAELIAFLDIEAEDYPKGTWIGVWEDSQGFVRHVSGRDASGT